MTPGEEGSGAEGQSPVAFLMKGCRAWGIGKAGSLRCVGGYIPWDRASAGFLPLGMYSVTMEQSV